MIVDDHTSVAIENLAARRDDRELFDAIALGAFVVDFGIFNLQFPESGHEEQKNGDCEVLENRHFGSGETRVVAKLQLVRLRDLIGMMLCGRETHGCRAAAILRLPESSLRKHGGLTSEEEIAYMTTQEVADKLVAYCKQGNFEEPLNELYSPDIVSMEAGAPPGGSRESKGLDGVKAKGKWWAENHEVHSAAVRAWPIASSSSAHFAVTFKLDVTFKPQSRRFTMEEVAVYKVADGKIVYEEFFYNM